MNNEDAQIPLEGIDLPTFLVQNILQIRHELTECKTMIIRLSERWDLGTTFEFNTIDSKEKFDAISTKLENDETFYLQLVSTEYTI